MSTSNGVRVSIPNGQSMQASHTADIDVDHLPISLPPAAKLASVFPHLRHKALISLGQFCDAGYDVRLTREAVYLCKDSIETKIGTRNSATNLWTMDVPSPLPPPPTSSTPKPTKSGCRRCWLEGG